MTRTTTRRRAALALVACLALLATACGDGDDGDGGESAGGDADGDTEELADRCPLGAIADATKPVEITYWHSMTSANEEALKRLADRYNASQGDVRVSLVNQTSYDDTLTKYRAALGGGALPDLVQLQDVDTRLVVDSASTLPAGACVEATDFDMDGVIARVTDYYTVDGVLQAVPFATSNPILYFNEKAFTAAGLDPADPPSTLDELRTAAEKLKASGVRFPLSIKQDSWYPEEWMAMAGETFANNGNGRDDRATEVAFDAGAGRDIAEWLAGMAGDELAQLTDPANFDNLLAIGSGVSAMTMETSAALGTILQVLGSGQYPNVELAAGPLPGPDGDGGTVQAGSANFIVAKSPPARQEAAWRFASWLTEQEQTAEWSAATGYIPLRASALDTPAIKDLWAKTPEFEVAYRQITTGTDNDASAGPMIGPMKEVRDIVEDLLSALFSGADVETELDAAAEKANTAIAAYEERVET